MTIPGIGRTAVREAVNKAWDVAIAGEIFIDHVFSGFERWPQPGTEYFTEDYVREVGGGAAITCCALARLGARVAIFGVVGEQDDWLRRRLQEYGVGLDGLQQSACGTAISVSISTREDRSFLTWPGANRDLEAYLSDRRTHDRLAQAHHVHLALPLKRSLAAELIPQLRAAHCTLSLDVGHQPEWLRDPANLATCREVDYFFPNELEGRLMTGLTDPEEILRELRRRGIEGAVLKLGPAGAAALDGDGICRATPPRVEAVDTTGAGDAFDAGFLRAVVQGLSLSGMLRYGCICGALSTRSAGALSALPSAEEFGKYQTTEER